MLAAQAAWAILESEHAYMRRLLAAIESLLQGEGWFSPGQAHCRLRELILELESFDEASHRPKGSSMLQALSGRSSSADGALSVLSLDRARNDDMLRTAKATLDRLVEGDPRSRTDCLAQLTRYREGLLDQMAREETILRSHAQQLLTEEEWSRVVSDISTRMAGQRPSGD
jgi:hemerythrin-like domain-containing protein